MSIPGPDQMYRKYYELYCEEQLKVLFVKPVMADIASIKYQYKNELLENAGNPGNMYIKVITSDELRLNLEYTLKRSLLFDIKLIKLTFKKVLSR